MFMEKISFNNTFVVEKEEGQLDIFGNVKGKERDYFGEALEEWFNNKRIYGLYKKFGRARAERVFNEMKKYNDHELKHFTQRLHHD